MIIHRLFETKDFFAETVEQIELRLSEFFIQSMDKEIISIETIKWKKDDYCVRVWWRNI